MRYLITGGSGYIGGRLVEILSARDDTEKIVNVDVKPPAAGHAKETFIPGDVRDRHAIRDLLVQENVDCLIHLAFIFNDLLHDEGRTYDIDVNGSQAVLWAASEAGTGQVLVTSSASAYGAFPDNPRPIAEDWPVRGAPDFSYPRNKAEVDRLCQLWAAEHPDRVMTIVRPCIVFSPHVDNFVSRSWDLPRVMLPDGVDEEFQLVHQDDVVSAIVSLIDERAGGAFNIAGDETLRYREAAALVGMKTIDIPFKRLVRLVQTAWRMRVPRVGAPGGSMRFFRYPWIVSTEKLKATTGWAPTRTTRECFEETMQAKGKLVSAPADEEAVATLGAKGA
jgi:UDP-glucose 4-epimerase